MLFKILLWTKLKFYQESLLLWWVYILVSHSLLDCSDFYHFFPHSTFSCLLFSFHLILCWINTLLNPSTHIKTFRSVSLLYLFMKFSLPTPRLFFTPQYSDFVLGWKVRDLFSELFIALNTNFGTCFPKFCPNLH
jgi:hypothetical protein